MARLLKDIAIEISQDWKNVSNYAKPYLDAMGTLNTISDMYYNDGASEIVLRFLCNAGQWKGEVARRVKAELKAIAGVK